MGGYFFTKQLILFVLLLILGFSPVASVEVRELACLINSEAEGETFEGKLAVGQVVLNRAAKNNTSLSHEIYKRGQFDGVKTKRFRVTPESLRAAKELVCGRVVFSPDILYFYNPRTSTDRAWINYLSSTHAVVIGNHNFHPPPTKTFREWKNQ